MSLDSTSIITSHALLTVSTQDDSILIQTLTFDDKVKQSKDNALPTESTKQKTNHNNRKPWYA
jgi:hypothetical protein